MIKDVIIGYVKSKMGAITAKTGKSEDEILSAIDKGKDGGYEMARKLGITKDVARQMYDKFGYLADKVPVIGRAIFDREYKNMLAQLDDEPQPNRETRRADAKKAQKFDKSKYFK